MGRASRWPTTGPGSPSTSWTPPSTGSAGPTTREAAVGGEWGRKGPALGWPSWPLWWPPTTGRWRPPTGRPSVGPSSPSACRPAEFHEAGPPVTVNWGPRVVGVGSHLSMASSWTAFFLGSFDAANAITVDKPPASLWVMALSVRLFGLSSWSILAPQALMGVATVGVLYLAVRRVAGPGAALFAGAATALTPVAVLMFRFNNPDALLVLLLTVAGYALTRAVEKA